MSRENVQSITRQGVEYILTLYDFVDGSSALSIRAVAVVSKRVWTGSWLSFDAKTGNDKLTITPSNFFPILVEPPAGVTITFPEDPKLECPKSLAVSCTLPYVGSPNGVVSLVLSHQDEGADKRMELQLEDVRLQLQDLRQENHELRQELAELKRAQIRARPRPFYNRTRTVLVSAPRCVVSDFDFEKHAADSSLLVQVTLSTKGNNQNGSIPLYVQYGDSPPVCSQVNTFTGSVWCTTMSFTESFNTCTS
jgi:hypothetical protein